MALLLDRLQSAIRKTLSNKPTTAESAEGQIVGYIASWRTLISENEVSQTEYEDSDLINVFKRMWSTGIVRLAKRDDGTGQWIEYSDSQSGDSAFFLNGPFRAKLRRG